MDETVQMQTKMRSTFSQFLAALAFKSVVLNTGIILSMPVIVIAALTSPGSSPYLTHDEASWFASLFFLVRPFATVVSGLLQDSLGRKLSIVLVNIPLFVSWLAMHYSSTATTLFFFAVLMGLSLGFADAPSLSYISEACEPRLRGVLGTLGSVLFNLGFLIPAVIGAFTDWRTMVLILAAFPVFTFLGVVMVPESPTWLVSKGRVEDARRAYQWLRGWVPPEVVSEEFDALVAYVKKDHETYNTDYTNSKTVKGEPESKLKTFLHPSVQRPFRLVLCGFLTTACTSLNAVRPFLIEFLKGLNLPIRPHIINVYASCLNLIGSVTSPLTIRILGKRGAILLSLGFCVTCCLGLGLYIYLDLQRPWVALLFFFVLRYAAATGLFPVPWILISEVYPLRARGVAAGISAASHYLIEFAATKTYIDIVSLVRVSGACVTYGMVGLLGMIYLYWNLPETEGVSMADIEEMFNNKSRAEKTPESEK